MQYTALGESGLIVSRFALGTMTFGQGEMVAGVMNDISQKQAGNMVAQALDSGVNFFDTADAYRRGESERMLGKALGRRRHAAIISTKVGFRMSEVLTDAGLSRRHILEAIDASLERLGTDYVDVYLVHVPDAFTPLEETLEALEDVVRAGKARYLGFSNFPAWRAQWMLNRQHNLGYTPFCTAQLYYSLLGRDIEHELAPCLRANGLGLMVWSPLASGFLTGKYNRDELPGDCRRERFDFPPVNIEQGYEVVDVLRDIGAAHAATPAQVALAWLLTREVVSTVIVGASSPEQLDENLGAINLALTPEDVQRLDELTAPAPIYPEYMIRSIALDAQTRNALRR